MAMAHVVLSWNAVSGATSYNVYRNGALLQSGLTSATYTDMSVTSGQTYTYMVTAAGPGGESPQSASAMATAPNPPSGAVPMTGITPPTNLAVHGFWQGQASDVLTWSPAPGAVSYNVYQYDVQIAKGVTGTSYTVPFSTFYNGLTYTVTAVDGMGMESIPSTLANAEGGSDPSQPPSWSPGAPVTPNQLVATPEWNNGVPRIRVEWHGDGNNFTYTVYRDGQKVADGLWVLYYIDSNVNPGETHTYTVTGENAAESAQGTPITATALSAAPAAAGAKVQVVKVVPNDDSAVVIFNPVPGAADYRVYDVSNPNKVKYAGRLTNQTTFSTPPTLAPLAIEWNGIGPSKGADLVVEAVDKLGPFQKMDGSMGPGAMLMNGTESVATNGQGDPSNVPNVLAASDVFHVTCQPSGLTGSQAFFDNFRGSQPLATSASIDPGVWAANVNNMTQVENDKWIIRDYQGDFTNTKAFFMGNHFMDTLFDGATAPSSVIHNNNASLVMMPKATADISGGKVLHVTFEVDAHLEGRRWIDLMIGAAGDPLTNPGKFDPMNSGGFATASGDVFRWEIHAQEHDMQVYRGGARNDLIQLQSWDDWSAQRIAYDHVTPLINGTAQDLDKRHRFDLYLSQTHYRIVETTPDGTFNFVREKDFPAGVQLPFTKLQVYFVHQLYHTANDRNEIVGNGSFDYYWANYRPWSDERHWDNMGFEVLDSFPS